MSATELIREGMALLEAHFPDRDPGDVTISVQDDMPLVILNVAGGGIFDQMIGNSIEVVAQKYLDWAKMKVDNEPKSDN